MIINKTVIRKGDGNKVINFIDVTIDNSFRINNIKIIKTKENKLRLVFPTNKIQKHCPKCRSKNRMSANFCNECGDNLISEKQEYSDIVFPIDPQIRLELEDIFLPKLAEIVL